MRQARPGDSVRVHTHEESIEGTLLPRPEILEPGILVLKLDNGYNIGIDESTIKDIEVLGQLETQKELKKPRPHNPDLPTIAILSTGGTISSRVDYRTGGTSAEYTAEDFLDMCPELGDIANLKASKILAKMSEDFVPQDWQAIAREVAKELETCDGVIVTQGTDTMHYTTAALSFLLKNLSKPVIFTASQRSIDRGSSDAFMNLICAVHAAASFDGAGVYTCMHGTSNDDYCLLIRGTKTRKMHTSRRDAFRPINEQPIARVMPTGRIEVINANYQKREKGQSCTVDESWESRVALVWIYPNMDPGIIDYHMEQGCKGLVLAATALGHVPSNGPRSLLPAIKKAQERGVPVIITSQTIYGRVHPYVYTNLRKLSIELGCVFVEDMLPEVAYIKLMYVLGTRTDLTQVKQKMQENLAGELTEKELSDTFLI